LIIVLRHHTCTNHQSYRVISQVSRNTIETPPFFGPAPHFWSFKWYAKPGSSKTFTFLRETRGLRKLREPGNQQRSARTARKASRKTSSFVSPLPATPFENVSPTFWLSFAGEEYVVTSRSHESSPIDISRLCEEVGEAYRIFYYRHRRIEGSPYPSARRAEYHRTWADLEHEYQITIFRHRSPLSIAPSSSELESDSSANTL
jgi:hypothetical protein